MADVEDATAPGLENVTQGSFNDSQAAVNGTGKVPSTPEGMALAYGSLVMMALVPIVCGAFRSVKHQQQQKAAGEKVDTMTSRDAAMFPIIASGALFSLYIIFTVFSKDYINLLLSSYFFILGVLALSHVFGPIISGLVPASVPFETYHLHLMRGDKEKKDYIINYGFTSYDLVCLVVCSILGVWYLLKKHWIANNLLGLAFAVNGVELLHLNNIQTGALLLVGLFIYDIFWVFGTNVMVTVAKSFEAPIKLVFPQDLLEKGLEADNFAMLGLGDIVIPGIFIALLLRFDHSLKRGSNTYFNVTFAAYFAGLLLTIFVMHVFKHAQPALLYLVPACLSAPVLLSLVKGDFKALLQYEDHPSDEEGEEKEAEDKKTGKKDK
ncbi:minor histocompatibility antigen H13-like [Portunus trituberculatus]|uniref:minor histocompatibility antigen H13-like n=1 Tax=Portunus trituberculatus TaxID=210409 RepID=UPI001E1D114A|nr:minor histocompatibility antigen H13-like [Portunus trituberculatus]